MATYEIPSISEWFKSHNITSHTVAASITGFFVLFSTDSQVRDFVLSLLKNHPEAVATLTAVAGIWLKYSSSRSPLGVLEEIPKAQAAVTANNQGSDVAPIPVVDAPPIEVVKK